MIVKNFIFCSPESRESDKKRSRDQALDYAEPLRYVCLGDIVIGRYGRDMLGMCSFVQYRFNDVKMPTLLCWRNAIIQMPLGLT